MEAFINKYEKLNWQIQSPKVFLIDDEGKTIGIVETKLAIAQAKEKGLDLMLVAEKADPPVARIIDFGKYKYKLEKQNRGQKIKSHQNELKEIQISMKINDHDLQIKLEKAKEFLHKKYRLRINLKMFGREMQFSEKAYQRMNQFLEDILPISKIETPPKREQNRIIAQVMPK